MLFLFISILSLLAIYDVVECAPLKHNFQTDSSSDSVVFQSNQMFSWKGDISTTCKGEGEISTEIFPHNYIETLYLENFTFSPFLPQGQKFYDVINFNIRVMIKKGGSPPMTAPTLNMRNRYGENLLLTSSGSDVIVTSYRMIVYYLNTKENKNFLSPDDKFSMSLDFGYYNGNYDDKIHIQCVEAMITYETQDKSHEVRPTEETSSIEETTSTQETTSTEEQQTLSSSSHHPSSSEENEEDPPEQYHLSFDLSGVVTILVIFALLFTLVFVFCALFPGISLLYKNANEFTLIGDEDEVLDELCNPNLLVLHNSFKKKTVFYLQSYPMRDVVSIYSEELSDFALFSPRELVFDQRVHSRVRGLGFTMEGLWNPLDISTIDKEILLKMLKVMVCLEEKGFVHRKISPYSFWCTKEKCNILNVDQRRTKEVRIFDIEKLIKQTCVSEYADDWADVDEKPQELQSNDLTYYQKTDVWFFVKKFQPFLKEFISEEDLKKKYLDPIHEERGSFAQLFEEIKK